MTYTYSLPPADLTGIGPAMSMFTRSRYLLARFPPTLCRRCADLAATHKARYLRSYVIDDYPTCAIATTVLNDKCPSRPCQVINIAFIPFPPFAVAVIATF